MITGLRITLTCLVAVLVLRGGLAAAPTAVADAFDAGREETRQSLRSSWDDEVGLWYGSTTLGPTGHDIRASAGALVTLGLYGLLGEFPHARVLANLRRAQETTGELRGNFWWSWEDGRVTDRNSGFFTTLALLALHHEFRDQLGTVSRDDLDLMLAEARHWFGHKVYPITDDKLRYPNAYFGDAVCLWLLAEREGTITPELTADFHRIVRYYLESPWGWAEHLSDMYAKVLQEQLLGLLLWQRRLPVAVVADVREMRRQLGQIDAWYEGGPRVPAVRNYWMEGTPGAVEERSGWFRPHAELMTPFPLSVYPQAHLGWRRGLGVPAGVEARTSPEVTVPVLRGRQALAWVDERWRLGVMSAYPIFDDMERRPGNGLAWQSMPAAFWHARGDWGYLQWVVEEAGKVRAHPAMSRAAARRDQAFRLSDDLSATVAETRGYRHGREFLVLRRMPRGSTGWTAVADRFRLVAGTHGPLRVDRVDGWHRLAVPYAEGALTVAYRPVVGEIGEIAEPRTESGEWSWGPRLSGAGTGAWAGLWFLTVGPEVAEPPKVQAAPDRGRRLVFADGVDVVLHDPLTLDPWAIHPRGFTREDIGEFAPE